MKRKFFNNLKLTSLIIFFFSSVIISQNSNIVESIDNLKNMSDFNNWPNKDGNIRAGIILTNSDIPSLSGMKEVLNLKLPSIKEIEGKFRVVFKYNWQLSTKDLIVVTESCQDAHQYLIERYFNTTLAFEDRVPNRDSIPIIGDISFSGGRKFIMNNIVGELNFEGNLERKQNQFIKELHGLLNLTKTSATSSNFKPIIKEFKLTNDNAQHGFPVELTIDVIDPHNSMVSYVWKIKNGGIVKNNGKYYYTPNSTEKVNQAITLYAVNNLGFVSKAQSNINN